MQLFPLFTSKAAVPRIFKKAEELPDLAEIVRGNR